MSDEIQTIETATNESTTSDPLEGYTDAEKAAIEKARSVNESAAPVEAEGDAEVVPQRPEGVPEEFWNAEKGEVKLEELVKAATAKPEEAAPAKEEGGEPAPAGALDFSDVDVQTLSAEVAQHGGFTEETVTQLAAKGVPAEMVELYGQGLAALAREQANSLFDIAGGKDSFNTMIKWAGDAITAEQADAFNAAIANPGSSEAKLAVENLYMKFTAAEGQAPREVRGETTGGTGADVYTSAAEVTADMRNPLYKKGDRAFVQKVAEKMARSRAAGFSMNGGR